MTTATLETKVYEFLAQKRIAVAGVSRNSKQHAAGPMMYADDVDLGHACMRWLVKLTGGLPT
jgi:hypothetical protein